jgi:hypothetical protein
VTLRTVGLSVGGPRPAELDDLIHGIGRTSSVVNVDGYPGRVDWQLVYRSPYGLRTDIPSVWFVGDREDVRNLHHPSVVISTDPALLDASQTRAPKLLVGRNMVELPAARPYAPYPRQRIRRSRGLPNHVVGVVTQDQNHWDNHAVGPEFTATILTCASVVVADAHSLLSALAYAAPVVTDPAAAAAIGAVDGEHVLVGSEEYTRTLLAEELAVDMARAARISWAGRRLFEDRYSVTHLTRRIDDAAPRLRGPAERFEQVLAALGTPDDAPIRARATARYHLPAPT